MSAIGETIDSNYFERKFAEAKMEYDSLGEALMELGDKETKTLDEATNKLYKMDRLMRKRMKLRDQQFKRSLQEGKYNTGNGLPPLTKLRDLDDECDENDGE